MMRMSEMWMDMLMEDRIMHSRGVFKGFYTSLHLFLPSGDGFSEGWIRCKLERKILKHSIQNGRLIAQVCESIWNRSNTVQP